jgi:hypothetical protein
MDKKLYKLLKEASYNGTHSIDCEAHRMSFEIIYGPDNEIVEQCVCYLSEIRSLLEKEDLRVVQMEVNALCSFCKHPRDAHSTSGVCASESCNCFQYK